MKIVGIILFFLLGTKIILAYASLLPLCKPTIILPNDINKPSTYLISNSNLKKPTLFLGPGGNIGPYILGVLAYIKENYDIDNINYMGVSAGSFISVIANYEKDLTDFDKLWNKYISNNPDHSIPIHNFNDIPNTIKNNILKHHGNKKINNNIGVFVSSLEKNNVNLELSYNYNNLDELLELCHCSSYIPLLSGLSINKKYKNNLNYFDGIFGMGLIKMHHIHFDNTIYITKDIWNRKFKTLDFLTCNYDHYKKMYTHGWNDSHLNKKKLKKLLKTINSSVK